MGTVFTPRRITAVVVTAVLLWLVVTAADTFTGTAGGFVATALASPAKPLLALLLVAALEAIRVTRRVESVVGGALIGVMIGVIGVLPAILAASAGSPPIRSVVLFVGLAGAGALLARAAGAVPDTPFSVPHPASG